MKRCTQMGMLCTCLQKSGKSNTIFSLLVKVECTIPWEQTCQDYLFDLVIFVHIIS